MSGPPFTSRMIGNVGTVGQIAQLGCAGFVVLFVAVFAWAMFSPNKPKDSPFSEQLQQATQTAGPDARADCAADGQVRLAAMHKSAEVTLSHEDDKTIVTLGAPYLAGQLTAPARALVIIAIVACGLLWAFTRQEEGLRKLRQVAFGGAIAMGAVAMLASLGFSGALV